LSYDAGDGWQTAEVRGKLIEKQAREIRKVKAENIYYARAFLNLHRLYKQGRYEEIGNILSAYASKLDSGMKDTKKALK